MIRRCATATPLWYAPDHDYGSHASVSCPSSRWSRPPPSRVPPPLARVKNTVTLPCYNIRTWEGPRISGAPLADYPSGDDMADASRANNREIETAVRKAPGDAASRPAPIRTIPATTMPSRPVDRASPDDRRDGTALHERRCPSMLKAR